MASTDTGDVSLAVPSIHPTTRYDTQGPPHHTEPFARHGTGPGAGRAVLDGAIALARTAVALATDPVERDRFCPGPRSDPCGGRRAAGWETSCLLKLQGHGKGPPMPHLTIDYSSRLAGVLDPCALVKELHPLVVEESGTSGVCKTLCRPAETFAGDGPAGAAVFVHVEVGLRPGRSAARKARLSESVLALLTRHVPGRAGERAYLSVEVRDLAASYRLSPSAR